VSPVRYKLGFYVPEDDILHEEWCSLGCYPVCFFAACVGTARVPSPLILVTLMKGALDSFETSFLTKATWRNIPEDTILHSYRRENLKSYVLETVLISEVYIFFYPFYCINQKT
jgi:hypothetical protein